MDRAMESREAFEARIAREDDEALLIACPLETCRAPIGHACKTEDGTPRLRHCRRLWLVRKLTEPEGSKSHARNTHATRL